MWRARDYPPATWHWTVVGDLDIRHHLHTHCNFYTHTQSQTQVQIHTPKAQSNQGLGAYFTAEGGWSPNFVVSCVLGEKKEFLFWQSRFLLHYPHLLVLKCLWRCQNAKKVIKISKLSRCFCAVFWWEETICGVFSFMHPFHFTHICNFTINGSYCLEYGKHQQDWTL